MARWAIEMTNISGTLRILLFVLVQRKAGGGGELGQEEQEEEKKTWQSECFTTAELKKVHHNLNYMLSPLLRRWEWGKLGHFFSIVYCAHTIHNSYRQNEWLYL